MAVSSVFVFRSGELRAGSQSSSSQHQAVEQQFHCDFGGIWKQDCVGQSRILTGESTIWRNVLAAPRRFEFVNIQTMVSNTDSAFADMIWHGDHFATYLQFPEPCAAA